MHEPGGTSAIAPLLSGNDPELTRRFRGAAAVVILPTLNEEQGLESTLAQLPLRRFADPKRRVEALVIDGGSTDRTVAVAQKWGIPVVRQVGRGKGTAVLEAIEWAHLQGIPYAIVLDADATYPPDRILPTLDLLEADADLVIGVRRPVWGPPRDGRDLIHRIGNLIFSYSASLLARRTILDLCSGYWGISTDRFKRLDVGAARFAIEAEIVLKAIRRGLRVLQIPVDYHERIGVAKLRAFRDGSRILLAIVRYARPAPAESVPGAQSRPWSRQLLSIGVIAGAPEAVVERTPARSDEANEVAGILRQALPDAIVRVSAATTPPSELASPGTEDGARPAEPFVVSLPVGGSKGLAASSITVTLRSEHRQLTIAIENPPSSPEPVRADSSAWSRSGVLLGRARPARSFSRFPSLEVLTSHLNYDALAQQRTLLEANGFHAVEAERVAPPQRPAAAEGA